MKNLFEFMDVDKTTINKSKNLVEQTKKQTQKPKPIQKPEQYTFEKIQEEKTLSEKIKALKKIKSENEPEYKIGQEVYDVFDRQLKKITDVIWGLEGKKWSYQLNNHEWTNAVSLKQDEKYLQMSFFEEKGYVTEKEVRTDKMYLSGFIQYFGAKSLAGHILHYVQTALSEGVAPKFIKIKWTQSAVEAWHKLLKTKNYPSNYNMETVKTLLLINEGKNENDTTNIWRGKEDFEPSKLFRNELKHFEVSHHYGIIASLEYIINFLEKEGMQQKEIVMLLEKSKKRGIRILYDAWHNDEHSKRCALEEIEEVSELMLLKEKGLLSKEQAEGKSYYFDLHWIEHLRNHVETIQKYAKLLDEKYEVSQEIQQIFRLKELLKNKINIDELPNKTNSDFKNRIKKLQIQRDHEEGKTRC